MAIRVRIQNFQSIEDETVKIDGFTAVTGPNNTGKSSLVRALIGAFSNMGGDDFVRHGARFASVEVAFQDGQIVRWEKGKGVNRYFINGKIYNSVGHGPPTELADLGVCPIVVNGKPLWPQIAHQHTGQVFLLDQPGSMIAESVADVERVGRLNRSLKKSESERREVSSKLKVRRGDINQLREECAKFAGVDDILIDIVAIQVKIDRNIKIGKIHEQFVNIRRKITRTKTIVDFLAGVDAVEVPDEILGTQMVKRADALKVLRSLRGRVNSARDRVEFFQAHQEELDSITINDPSFQAQIVRANKARKALGVVRDLYRRYHKAKKRCSDYRDLLSENQKELLEITESIEGILGEMAMCPVCKSQIVNHEV